MNQQYVLDQLRSGDKTVREIAESYVYDHPDYTVYRAMCSAQQRLSVLKKQGFVKIVNRISVSIESKNIVNGRIFNTHKMNVWRLTL